MQETSARLLRLLSMLQARPDWTGAELAQRLDITGRTLRRDVQRLRGLGYPVHASPGVAGGYRLGAGSALPPLLLDDEEAVAVVVSLRTAASHTVTGIEETSLRALAKLEQVLPARLRERTAALQLATVPLPSLAPTIDAERLTVIARACRSHLRLTFSYTDHGGAVTARSVEPHRIVHTGRRWYLVARDIDRDGWRSFRVDRIAAPEPAGIRFVPRDPPDAASFVATSVTAAPYRFRARIIVHAPAAVIAQLVPPTVGVLEPAGQDGCLLTTGSDSLDALAFHLAMLGADFTVLEPAELIAQLAALGGRLQAAARRSAAPQTD
jgi:predicted DNA-binding transcriptional regulator YafY